MSDDHFEPIPGLPEVPPEGERILWQGRPAWRPLAWRTFGLRWFAVYFAALAVLAAAAAWRGGLAAAAAEAAVPVALGVLLAALVAGYARLSARHTIYTITDRRIVVRSGVAVDMAVNLPLALIDGAALRTQADGIGDIRISIAPPHRVAWLALWPHTRMTHLRQPQPVLRAVPQAAAVARVLTRALEATGGMVRTPWTATRADGVPAGLPA